jgi:hypothetical protein
MRAFVSCSSFFGYRFDLRSLKRAHHEPRRGAADKQPGDDGENDRKRKRHTDGIRLTISNTS